MHISICSWSDACLYSICMYVCTIPSGFQAPWCFLRKCPSWTVWAMRWFPALAVFCFGTFHTTHRMSCPIDEVGNRHYSLNVCMHMRMLFCFVVCIHAWMFGCRHQYRQWGILKRLLCHFHPFWLSSGERRAGGMMGLKSSISWFSLGKFFLLIW